MGGADRIHSDGAVPIDNNVSEPEMKRVVLNRKNSLFVARGGRTAAILASLVLNNINTVTYNVVECDAERM
jgi:hypothetical protein